MSSISNPFAPLLRGVAGRLRRDGFDPRGAGREPEARITVIGGAPGCLA